MQYTINSKEPVEVIWNKYIDQSYQPISSPFTVESNRIILKRAAPKVAGAYQVIVRNSHGENRQNLRINIKPRRRQQRKSVKITIEPNEVTIEPGEKTVVKCHVKGARKYRLTWKNDANDTSLSHYQQGNDLIIAPIDDTPGGTMNFKCQVDVSGQSKSHHASVPITIRDGKKK
ncbi:hypothetical protein I4U23_017316 [Adineta vaga]|nr:hypothetical protein I4U23_017316 [Adineta vaga]